jgi:DNA-binding response OmpR family regulator
MPASSLVGRTILIAEGEPLIAMDIADAFAHAGARVMQVQSLKAALAAAEDTTLSAAIIEHVLSDGDSTGLCARLCERKILCVVYTGYPNLEMPLADALHVPKPADPQLLVTMVSALLEGRPTVH